MRSTSSHPFVFFSSFFSLRSQSPSSLLTHRSIHSFAVIHFVCSSRCPFWDSYGNSTHTRAELNSRVNTLFFITPTHTHIVTLLSSPILLFSHLWYRLQHVQKGHRRVLLVDVPVREHWSTFINSVSEHADPGEGNHEKKNADQGGRTSQNNHEKNSFTRVSE